MEKKYKFYLSQKKCDIEKKIIDTENKNILKPRGYLPNCSRKNYQFKYSDCTSKQSFNNKQINKDKDIYKKYCNRITVKEDIISQKIYNENAQKITKNETNKLKQNNIINKKENREKYRDVAKNRDTKIEEIKFNSMIEKINSLNKKIEENTRLFEDYKAKNEIKTENNKNFIKKIMLEYIKNIDGQNEESKKQNEEIKRQIYELKRQNEELKNHIESKNYSEESKNQNEEIKKQIYELKNQNEEIKKQIYELKKQNEKLKKLYEEDEEITKQNTKLIKYIEEETNNQNEKIIKYSEELEKLKQELKKKNEKENKIEKKFFEKKFAVVGLSNPGNCCYMNSVLQILKNIPQFTYNIFQIKDNLDNFLIELKKLFVNLCSPDASVFSPKDFKKYLGLEKLGKKFSGNEQNDSSIFYISLLNIIDKKLNNEKIMKIDMSKYKDKTLEERVKIYKRNDYSFKKETFIFDAFYIYYVNEIKCKKCKEVNHIFQKMNFLDFAIVNANGNIKSLEECFDNYQKIRDVKDTCNRCKSFGVTHEYILLELPPVLMINLKRVGEQSTYYNEIEIPQKLDMRKIIKSSVKAFTSIYELRGFIKHEGDEKSGHNYAFCKNMFDDKWYEYNDDKCRDVYGEPNLNKIFFLCYIKIGSDFENIDYLEEISNELKYKKKTN